MREFVCKIFIMGGGVKPKPILRLSHEAWGVTTAPQASCAFVGSSSATACGGIALAGAYIAVQGCLYTLTRRAYLGLGTGLAAVAQSIVVISYIISACLAKIRWRSYRVFRLSYPKVMCIHKGLSDYRLG